MQCDGKAICVVSDTDSSQEVSASQQTSNQSILPKKRKTGEIDNSTDVEILEVTSAKVARHVEIIYVQPPTKKDKDIEIIKYIPPSVKPKNNQSSVDVLDVSGASPDQQEKSNSLIDLTSPGRSSK